MSLSQSIHHLISHAFLLMWNDPFLPYCLAIMDGNYGFLFQHSFPTLYALVRTSSFPTFFPFWLCTRLLLIEICLILPPFLAEFVYHSAYQIICINTAPESHDLAIRCCVLNFLWCMWFRLANFNLCSDNIATVLLVLPANYQNRPAPT